MKVLFIQREISMYEPIGIMQLSSILKERHECEFLVTRIESSGMLKRFPKKLPIIFSHFKNEKNDINERLLEAIIKTKPDVIAFRTTTGEHTYNIKLSQKIKKEIDVFSVFGGPHPTFYPQMIEAEGVDAVCVGEGDYAFLELVNNLEDEKDITNIRNMWVKSNGKIYKNPVRPLIDNLDILPFPDRELIYDKYPHLRDFQAKHFMATRGCPYNCSYCFNHAYKKIYEGKGLYVRARSVDNVIEEIKSVKRKYNLGIIRFNDDTFILSEKWITEFSEKYKKEVDLPFICNVRANLVSEKITRLLKHAGLYSVTIGIESGNEHIRNNILNRGLNKEQIVKACKIIKNEGILLTSENMLGLPTESIDDAFKTLDLNIECGVDNAGVHIFNPYPKTEIIKHCEGFNKDYDNFDASVHSHSILNLEDKKEIENLHNFFAIGVNYPFLVPVIRKMVRMPKNPVFSYIYKFYGITSSARKSFRRKATLGVQKLL